MICSGRDDRVGKIEVSLLKPEKFANRRNVPSNWFASHSREKCMGHPAQFEKGCVYAWEIPRPAGENAGPWDDARRWRELQVTRSAATLGA